LGGQGWDCEIGLPRLGSPEGQPGLNGVCQKADQKDRTTAWSQFNHFTEMMVLTDSINDNEPEKNVEKRKTGTLIIVAEVPRKQFERERLTVTLSDSAVKVTGGIVVKKGVGSRGRFWCA